MKKLYTLLIFGFTIISFGQVSITALNVPYNENFDGMGTSGTTFPANWTAIRAGGSGTANQTLTMAVTDGLANSGNIYNVGTTGNTDRAFGSIASGTTFPGFGMSLINNTGDKITEFNITLTVEQWRTGSSSTANEVIAFSYSTDATSLSTGTWTNATNLNLNEILTTTTTSAAVNGNTAGNNALLNGTVNISSTPWLNGATLWIKWTDADDAGSDCLLAIDDFTFKATSNVLSSASLNSISGLTMYPNPLSGNTLFITSTANAEMNVKIYNVLGKEVLSTKVNNTTVDVSNLASGVYMVKITEEGNTATRKLVIK